MFDLFWDFHQQRRIWDLDRTAKDVRRKQDRQESKTERLEERVSDLERRLDKQTLVVMALWELLERETSLTREQLLAEVERIDLLDGKLDGRFAPEKTAAASAARSCRACGRPLSRTHRRCFYCGETDLYDDASDVGDVL